MGEGYKIVGITGATGFIGSFLTQTFQANGYKVIPLGRKLLDGFHQTELEECVAKCDLVVNLAGAPINQRWSSRAKAQIRESRVSVTHRLVAALNRTDRATCLISSSAVGRYPSNRCYTDNDTDIAHDFLGELCRDWEDEAAQLSPNKRLCIVRFGVVLSSEGGAFSTMTIPYKLGVATALHPSSNYFSWIDIHDLCQIVLRLAQSPDLRGRFNVTAPEPCTQAEITQLLKKRYITLFTMPVYPMMMKLIMGQAAQLVTKSNCVKPIRILEDGYGFISPTIGDFIAKI